MAFRLLRFAAVLLLAALIHFAGAKIHDDFALAVDLFLVVLVGQALPGEAGWALFTGVVVGFVEDTFNGRLYGLYGCADTVVAYLCAVGAQRIVVQRATGVFVAFFAAAALQQALLIALALSVLPDAGRPEWIWIVVKATSTALLGTMFYLIVAAWRRRFAHWRRGRNARLQFGR